MDCSQNDFCKSLSVETRRKLCSKCKRKFFKAQSMQMGNDCSQSCMLVLDGAFTTTTDLGHGFIDHENELPMLYLGLPGRLLNLSVTFKYDELNSSIGYIDYHYLADTWTASFSHHMIRTLCDEDEAFRHAVYRNMVALIADVCQISALFRPNYLHYGVFHLVSMLEKAHVFLTQQQLATLLNRDRTSISKVFATLKKEHPDLLRAYMSNKNRAPSRPYPKSRTDA